jgi:hypothetical protein
MIFRQKRIAAKEAICNAIEFGPLAGNRLREMWGRSSIDTPQA